MKFHRRFILNFTLQKETPRSTGQIKWLLSTLPERGPKAYESFISALNKIGNGEVADHLVAKDGSKRNEVSSAISGKPDNALSRPKVANGDTQETENIIPKIQRKLKNSNHRIMKVWQISDGENGENIYIYFSLIQCRFKNG